jgi:hypothetical protein
LLGRYQHCEDQQILAEQQKGCVRKALGCKEQTLTIDTVVTRQAYTRGRRLHIAYNDYEKAYDSVPHSWLCEILKLYRVDRQLIKFLENMMKQWETTLILNTRRENIKIEGLKIKRGIFQGDTLSSLWFCMVLNPISSILNGNARNEAEMDNMLKKVTEFSNRDEIWS